MTGRAPGDRVARGRAGEEVAALHLSWRGYTILARNQRTPMGELDLICRAGRQIVVVEVKARGSDRYGAALEAVDLRKTARIRAAAVCWLADKGLFPCQVRFDAVVVGLDREGLPCTLEHIRDLYGEGA